MAGYGPSGSGSQRERLRNVREPDLQGSGQVGGGLGSELADGAVLIGCVGVMPDVRGGCGPEQRYRENADPETPAKPTP